MNRAVSAREALIAEAIGDLAKLLDRVDTFRPAMMEANQALVDASSQLITQLANFEDQVTSLSAKAKVQVVKHVLARVEEANEQAIEQQARAMAEAARSAFDAEVAVVLQQLKSASPQHAAGTDRRWERWLTHMATAAVAASATWALAVTLMVR